VEQQYVEHRVETGQPVVHEQVVRQERVVPVAPVAPVASRRVAWSRTFDPASVLAVLLSIVLGVVGAVALARAGLDGPLDEPVVEVAGFTHTALLGLVELGMALVLLIAGLSRDRGAILFVSILFGVASLVAAIEPTVGGGALAVERAWAWLMVVSFGLVALVAAVVPAIWRSSDRVETYRA
jgi:hypothetical protein